jgi:glutaredoxin/glutathione-dependent peroxiredoxin
MIKVGDKFPEATVIISGNPSEQGACAIPQALQLTDFIADKTVILFAVPGAFTPGCHKQHLPGFVANYESLKAKGVDVVACIATNDIFVMDAWGKALGAEGKVIKSLRKVLMMADGNGELAKALGLEKDLTKNGMGVRFERFAMIIKDGVLKHLEVGDVEVTGALNMLSKL